MPTPDPTPEHTPRHDSPLSQADAEQHARDMGDLPPGLFPVADKLSRKVVLGIISVPLAIMLLVQFGMLVSLPLVTAPALLAEGYLTKLAISHCLSGWVTEALILTGLAGFVFGVELLLVVLFL